MRRLEILKRPDFERVLQFVQHCILVLLHPARIPPDTRPGAPDSVLETAITCDVTYGAAATTPGIAAIFFSSSLGFHTPPSARSIVTSGVNASSRARRSFSEAAHDAQCDRQGEGSDRYPRKRDDRDHRQEALAPPRQQISESNQEFVAQPVTFTVRFLLYQFLLFYRFGPPAHPAARRTTDFSDRLNEFGLEDRHNLLSLATFATIPGCAARRS